MTKSLCEFPRCVDGPKPPYCGDCGNRPRREDVKPSLCDHGDQDDVVQLEPLPARDQFLLLRIEARDCARLEYELQQRRESRDRIALRLVDQGFTWRDVASVAGFKNPYIATLKKRLRDG